MEIIKALEAIGLDTLKAHEVVETLGTAKTLGAVKSLGTPKTTLETLSLETESILEPLETLVDLKGLEGLVVDIDRNDFEEFPVMLHPEEELAGNL